MNKKGIWLSYIIFGSLICFRYINVESDPLKLLVFGATVIVSCMQFCSIDNK